MTAAQDKLDAANARIEAIPGEIDALETELRGYENAVTEAKANQTEANEALTAANGELKAAEDALADLGDAQIAWQKEHDRLSGELTAAQSAEKTAKGELEAAQKTVDDLNTQIADLQKQIDELQSQIDQGTEQAVDDFVDFLKWYDGKFAGSGDITSPVSYLNVAYHILTGTGGPLFEFDLADGSMLSDYTHVGTKGDATDLDNVKASLEIISRCNELRKQAGLDPIQVSINLMAISMLQTNWSATHQGHAQNNMTGDNAHVR